MNNVGFGHERDLDEHEKMIYSLPYNKLRTYRMTLEDEMDELADTKLRLLRAKDRYLEMIEGRLADVETRMKEINYDFRIIEEIYPPPPDSDEDEDEMAAYLSGCLY